MAFYSARVDDEGNEMERLHTARTYSVCNSARSGEPKSSVRFINTAASIEKAIESNGECHLELESERNIVPSLDLPSEENQNSYSCRKSCFAPPNTAHKNWLSAKMQILSHEAARRQRLEEERQQQQEERKRLSKQKFEEWLQKKTQMQQTRTKTTRVTEQQKVAPDPMHEEETRLRLEEWEHRKRLEEEHKRLLKREEDQRRIALDEERRQLADEAWNKWISEAARKPKPVPLNRGIFTLRGTISDIFINPNEWQGIVENDAE